MHESCAQDAAIGHTNGVTARSGATGGCAPMNERERLTPAGSGWLPVRYTSAANIKRGGGTPHGIGQAGTAEQFIACMQRIATERIRR